MELAVRTAADRSGRVAAVFRTRLLARVQLHRNNAYYDFLLKVARLAFDCLLPTSDGRGFQFEDVLRDERKMAVVFEDFVRNFYRTEQSDFSVEPLTIGWDAQPLVETGAGRLPGMRVDVFLRSPTRRIIIDTKYYAKALQSYHDTVSYHSGNLYQIFAYLKNAAGHDPLFGSAEGMLLYPCAGLSLKERYRVQGHELSIATLDLCRPWLDISMQLRDVIGIND